MAQSSKKASTKAAAEAEKKARKKATAKAKVAAESAAAKARSASAFSALEGAAAAARQAKRVAKTLPDGAAKKLRALADEAKEIASTSKKHVERQPEKAEKKAVRAAARIEKAIAKAPATTKPTSSAKALPTAKARPAPQPSRVRSVPVQSTPELSELTVAQLRQRARDAGLTGYSRLTKAQLVALLSS